MPLDLCSRCHVEIAPEGARWPWRCWWCSGLLCQACWEDPAHCGHPEAEQANRDSADTDYEGREAILARRPGKPTEH